LLDEWFCSLLNGWFCSLLDEWFCSLLDEWFCSLLDGWLCSLLNGWFCLFHILSRAFPALKRQTTYLEVARVPEQRVLLLAL
jgi:hypothetical protein